MLKNKNWWRAAAIRALKTVAQTAIATIGTAALTETAETLIKKTQGETIMTERERLHAMTDEELAAWLADHPKVTKFDRNNSLHADWLQFLKSEVK